MVLNEIWDGLYKQNRKVNLSVYKVGLYNTTIYQKIICCTYINLYNFD